MGCCQSGSYYERTISLELPKAWRGLPPSKVLDAFFTYWSGPRFSELVIRAAYEQARRELEDFQCVPVANGRILQTSSVIRGRRLCTSELAEMVRTDEHTMENTFYMAASRFGQYVSDPQL